MCSSFQKIDSPKKTNVNHSWKFNAIRFIHYRGGYDYPVKYTIHYLQLPQLLEKLTKIIKCNNETGVSHQGRRSVFSHQQQPQQLQEKQLHQRNAMLPEFQISN